MQSARTFDLYIIHMGGYAWKINARARAMRNCREFGAIPDRCPRLVARPSRNELE